MLTRISHEKSTDPAVLIRMLCLILPHPRSPQVLGYKATKWNEKFDNVKAPEYTEKKWKELTPEEREALLVLGYTSPSFNHGSVPLPPSTFKSWHELTVCGEDRCMPHFPYAVNLY